MSRPRRDPRAEAVRRIVPGDGRPRSTIEIAVVPLATAAVTSPGGRQRRDPRAEIAAIVVPASRRRLDRSLAASAAAAGSASATGLAAHTHAPGGLANLKATASGASFPTAGALASTTVRTIASPACLVLVVPDAPGGRAAAHDRQLLGAARLLADAAGGAVVVVTDGGAWGTLGADRVLSLTGKGTRSLAANATQPSPLAGEGREGGRPDLGVAFAAPPLPTLPLKGGGAPNADVLDNIGNQDASGPEAASSPAPYDPEARAAVLVAAIRALAPRHIVFAETTEGGDLARRVAALVGEPLFAGAESITARTVTRPAKAGRVEQRTAPPRLLSLLPDIVAAHAGPPHEARPVTLADLAAEGIGAAGGSAEDGEAIASLDPAPRHGILSAETIPADPAKVPLAEASFVVSAGNGVTDFAGFHRLVDALGATPGASRVVCDAGLMARERQVGASGTVLDATCYFALGIAGAPQHLQGVAKCEHVVAVNTDLHAAMIERAGLAVVADAQKVMPALAALLAEERGGASAATGALGVPSGGDPAGGDPEGDAARAGTLRPTERPGAETLDALPPDPLTARVLLSAGRHPVSGRAAPVRAEAQATALALAIGADVRGLHAGGDGAVVADHLGHGLGTIEVAANPAEVDPLPALVAALARQPADLVLMGRRGVGGDDSGQLPYRLAAALGLPVVADAVALAREPGRPDVLVVDQALPRGARRRVRVTLPAVVTVHPAAPSPRPFAFAAVRRGRLVPVAVEAGTAAAPPVAAPTGGAPSPEERPWRRRPRLIAGASTAGTAAERLKAATEVAGGGGRLLVDPAPDEAAREILAFLRGIGVLAAATGDPPPPRPV